MLAPPPAAAAASVNVIGATDAAAAPAVAGAVDPDALLWTLALAAAAYFSGYTSEGYEPHKF